MLNLRAILLILVLFVLVVLTFTPLVAQTATANLSGTVEDQNSAVVPDASITIRNKDTAFERTVTTNESGSFNLSQLPPGNYSLVVRRDGFTAVEIRPVILNVGDRKNINIALKVGDVNSTVEIRQDDTLINTSPAVATTVDRTFVQNLPLSGRSFQSLILLAPGITVTQADSHNPGQFSVNGQRSNANYFTVDGVSANTGVGATRETSNVFSQQAGGALPGLTALGGTTSLVPIDALEEFTIQTSSYSAELGRQPGGQVQLVTRSGTNEFHGSLFEYVRNDIFDAQNWFNTELKLRNPDFRKPPLRQNQFGGTFGGPVFLPRFGEGNSAWYNGRNKTFFFFSYEGQRLRLPSAQSFQVPSLRLREIAHPALRKILNSLPLPTGPEEQLSNGTLTGVAPFRSSHSNPANSDSLSIRLDHSFGGKVQVFGRFSNTSSNNLTRELNRLYGTDTNNRSITIGVNASFSSSVSSESRFNYTESLGRGHYSMDNFGGAVPIEVSDIVTGFSASGAVHGQMLFSMSGGSFFAVAGDPADSYQRQLNITENLTWLKGDHRIRFGVDFRRLLPVYGPVTYAQFPSFYSEEQISSGVGYLRVQAYSGARPRFDNYSLYAADAWQVSPRLSLDLGLRWEFNPPPTEASGRKPTTVIGINGTDVSQARLAPADAPFYKTFYTAFAPRIGGAYLLRQKTGFETVLRAGFGFYYDLGSQNAFSGFSGHPFLSQRDSYDVQFPFAGEAVQPPPFGSATLQTWESLYALDPDLKLPLSLSWNAAVEQSLGSNQTITLSYVASAGRRLLATRNFNNVPPGLPRPNPNFGSILYTANGPTSDYHSFQAQFQRRLSKGFAALAAYTWSHAIDEVSSEIDSNALERGNASFDVRHKVTAAISYDLPQARFGRFLGAILNGWSVDGILLAQSGSPLNVIASFSRVTDMDGTSLTVRPDVVNGVPFWIDNPAAPGGRQINPAAFTPPPGTDGCPPWGCFVPTRQGTLGRNVVIAPGIYTINADLRRRIKFNEKMAMELKAEVFNVFNHPLFGGYETSLSSLQFGFARNTLNQSLGGQSSLYQIGGPRSMQFSLRFIF